MFQAHLENYAQPDNRATATVSVANGCTERLNRVRSFLAQENFQGFTHQELFMPAWHSIAALSNMAEAISNLSKSKTSDTVRLPLRKPFNSFDARSKSFFSIF